MHPSSNFRGYGHRSSAHQGRRAGILVRGKKTRLFIGGGGRKTKLEHFCRPHSTGKRVRK